MPVFLTSAWGRTRPAGCATLSYRRDYVVATSCHDWQSSASLACAPSPSISCSSGPTRDSTGRAAGRISRGALPQLPGY